MVETLIFLTSVTLVLLVGLLSIFISKKLKFPLPLVLFVLGVILGSVYYYGRPVVDLGGDFLAAFSIIALLVVLFDSTSRIKFYAYDKSMHDATKMFVITLILNLIFISYFVGLFFNLNLFSSIIFSFLITCIEYLTIFPKHHVPSNKLTQLLKDESNLSCAFILLVPFLILSSVKALSSSMDITLFAKAITIATNIFAGIGTGIIIALVLFQLMNRNYLEKISSFVLAIGLLLAYVIAERIGGNGWVAAATIGFIFGNIFLKQKNMIMKDENLVYSALEVLMFIIVGAVVGIPLTSTFLISSLMLFLIYLLVRFISAQFALRSCDFNEKLEIALFVPKGLATVAVAFALLNYSFTGVVSLVQILLAFFVYSLILDTILEKAGVYKHR